MILKKHLSEKRVKMESIFLFIVLIGIASYFFIENRCMSKKLDAIQDFLLALHIDVKDEISIYNSAMKAEFEKLHSRDDQIIFKMNDINGVKVEKSKKKVRERSCL